MPHFSSTAAGKGFAQSLLKVLREPELPTRFSKARRRLWPVFQHDSFVTAVCTVNAPEAPPATPAYVAIAGAASELIACIAYAHEGGRRLLEQADLAQWRVSGEQALAAALENLRGAEDAWAMTSAGGVLISGAADEYNAERLLLTCAPRSAPPLIALVAQRHRLLLAPENDEPAQFAMVELAERTLDESLPCLTAQPLVWREGQWQIFTPSAYLKPQFARLQLRCRVLRDREEAQCLRARLRAQGNRQYVAELQLLKDPSTGLLSSVTVWPHGVVSWLPAADYVAFYHAPKVLRVARFLEVLAQLPQLIERAPGQMQRWRTEGFPDLEQLSLLSPVSDVPLISLESEMLQ
jgi:hypothetical protein